MNRILKFIIGLVVIVLVVWGGWWVLSGKSPTSVLGSTYKVGFIGPLTGDASSIGTVNKAAVEVAVDEVNKAGGVNGKMLEVIYEDGQCDGKTANNAANKLVNVDKVVAILGGTCSGETSAFGPMAMQNKIIVMSPSSSAPPLSSLGKYFFRDYPSDAFQGKFGADYAYNTLGARKVAVVYHISDWGTGIKNVFEQEFKALGGQIVDEEGSPQTSKDYRTELTKVKGLNPDLIYMPTYPDGGTIALQQASQLGIKTKILGADAWDDPKLQKNVSGLGLYLLYTKPVSNPPDSFKQSISAKTGGNEIPVGTPNAYDNVKILAMAMSQVGTNPDALQQAIRQTKYDGVSGHIEFDQNGDLTTASYVVSKIENGSAMEVK